MKSSSLDGKSIRGRRQLLLYDPTSRGANHSLWVAADRLVYRALTVLQRAEAKAALLGRLDPAADAEAVLVLGRRRERVGQLKRREEEHPKGRNGRGGCRAVRAGGRGL